jgi:hypothetical protein
MLAYDQKNAFEDSSLATFLCREKADMMRG